MRVIRLGNNLSMEGDASPHLLECLSGLEFPLAGVVEKAPYVRGSEVLENYGTLLPTADIYLVRKSHVMQILSNISAHAFAEMKCKYKELIFLPFRRRSCEIMM